jgi:thioredoxin 1
MKILHTLLLLGAILFSTQTLSAKDDTLLNLTDANYRSTLLNSDKPILVKFWASWCRPCKQMTPYYKEASKTFEGKVIFSEVNIDTQTKVASAYQISSLPTIILFNKNKIIKQNIGLLNKEEIEAFVNDALK